MEILERLNRYNEQYQRVPAQHEPLINFANNQFATNYRTLDSIRRYMNRSGIYNLSTIGDTVRVLGVEKARAENEQAQENRRLAEETQTRLREEKAQRKALRAEAKIQRRAERAERNRLRAVRREAKALSNARGVNNPVQIGEARYTYKSSFGSNSQYGRQRFVEGLNLPFTSTSPYIEELIGIIGRCVAQIPAGYYYSVRLQGTIFKGNSIEKIFTTIAITFPSNNIDEHIEELLNHSNIDLPSDRYAIIKDVSVFFEPNQGGKFTQKGYDNLREELQKYKVFCPKTMENCGKVCLAMYNIDVEEGHLPFAYMKSKSIVPVVDNTADVTDECILLHEGHYFVIKSLKKLAEDKRVSNRVRSKKMRESEAYKSKQAEDKIKRKIKEMAQKTHEVVIYDIESEKRVDSEQTRQIPVMLSHTDDGKNATTYYGLDCADRFIKYLLSPQGALVKYVYAFNGGNYDHILIRNAIISNGLSIRECRRSTNSIIRMTALVCGKQKKDGSYADAREIVFADLLSFTRGSLRANFRDYGIAEKGTFDYEKINDHMEDEDITKLREYCEWDTCGSFKLYEKMRDIFNELGLNMNELFTLSQGAYKLLKATWKGKSMDKFRQPKYVDGLGRKASIGGRTEVFKHSFVSEDYETIKSGGKTYEQITDYLQVLDVISQYPSAMASNPYPVGDYTHTKTFQEDYLGIYECSITKPTNIKFPVVFDKSRGSYNLLQHDGFHTSVDIKQMREYGYVVTVIEGVYWKKSEHIFEEYIMKMFEKKNTATKKTPTYEMYKTFINAVFGKTLQNDDHEEYFVIKSMEDLEKMYKGRNLRQFKMEWEYYEDGPVGYYTYVTAGKEKQTTDKLGHIGAFILSYSKQKIYRELSKSDAYYMDTDSLFLHRSDAEKVQTGVNLGDFSDDLDGGRIIKAIFISKKMYYLEYVMPNGSIKVKTTGKGVERGALESVDYENMLNNEVVNVTKHLHFVRDVKNGRVLQTTPSKNIKMNSGGRVFIGVNNSVPLGYVEVC